MRFCNHSCCQFTPSSYPAWGDAYAEQVPERYSLEPFPMVEEHAYPPPEAYLPKAGKVDVDETHPNRPVCWACSPAVIFRAMTFPVDRSSSGLLFLPFCQGTWSAEAGVCYKKFSKPVDVYVNLDMFSRKWFVEAKPLGLSGILFKNKQAGAYSSTHLEVRNTVHVMAYIFWVRSKYSLTGSARRIREHNTSIHHIGILYF